MKEKQLQNLSELYKAMSDLTRLKIIDALLDGEATVTQISALVGMSQSVISHQLRILKDRYLVKCRREGRFTFYSLDDAHVAELLNVGMEHIRHQNRGESL